MPFLGPQLLWYQLRQMRFEKPTRLDGRLWVNANLPPLGSMAHQRALEGLARMRQGEKPLLSLCLALTARCPMSCFYCSAKTYAPGPELTTNRLTDLISEARQLGAYTVSFTGGEPMLRDDLAELVAASRDMVTLLFTSGYAFPEIARPLKDAGLDVVVISLDTFDEETYCRRRGHPQAFRIALDAVHAAIDAGFYTALGMMLDESMLSTEAFDAFIEQAASLGVHEVRPLGPRPCLALGRENTHILTRAQTDLVASHARRLSRRADLPTVLSLDLLEYPEQQGCIGGSVYYFVTSTGDVTPCEFAPLSFGNVNNLSLADIHARMTRSFPQPLPHCPLTDMYRLTTDVPDNDLPVQDLDRSERHMRQLRTTDQPLPGFWRALLAHKTP